MFYRNKVIRFPGLFIHAVTHPSVGHGKQFPGGHGIEEVEQMVFCRFGGKPMPVSSLGRVVAALGKLAFGVLEQLAPAVLGQGSEPGPEAALLVMFKVLKVGKNTDHRLLKNVLHRMRINPPQRRNQAKKSLV